MNFDRKTYSLNHLVSADIPMRKTSEILYRAAVEKVGETL